MICSPIFETFPSADHLVQKWSKGKQTDKVNNAVIFDKAAYDKLMTEIRKSKLITPSIVSERLRVNVSLARQAIKDLAANKLIKCVGSRHHAQLIYTRATAGGEEE